MPSSLPIFIAPAALARLGHPDGEMNLVRAAGKAGILQGVRHMVKGYEEATELAP
jgi:L-lactate dehydrogenase (cytochrome)